MSNKFYMLSAFREAPDVRQPLLSSTDSVVNISPIDKALPNDDRLAARKKYCKLGCLRRSRNVGNASGSAGSQANIVPRVLLLLAFAFTSLLGIIALVKTIPNLSLPTSIEEVKKQALILEDYSNGTWRGYLHVFSVLAVIYVWKQAFCVPGAIFLNILSGALYGPMTATILTSLLAAIGASAAYLLSKFCGRPMLDLYLSDKVIFLRKQVDENRDSLFFYLLFIRMFPFSPWWLLNLASPLLFIPLGPFFTSMFFGSIPYNLACCQAGDILSELQSTTDIWQPIILLKMLLVSVLSLIPALFSRRMKKNWGEEGSKIGGGNPDVVV